MNILQRKKEKFIWFLLYIPRNYWQKDTSFLAHKNILITLKVYENLTGPSEFNVDRYSEKNCKESSEEGLWFFFYISSNNFWNTSELANHKL